MPLTDELGNLCLERLPELYRPHVPTFAGNSFEVQLSTWATEQPYLGAAENTFNRSMFEAFSGAIADVLLDRQGQVLQTVAPQWLASFLITAYLEQAAVITFNYDNLLECLTASCYGPLDDPQVSVLLDPFFWDELTGGTPHGRPVRDGPLGQSAVHYGF